MSSSVGAVASVNVPNLSRTEILQLAGAAIITVALLFLFRRLVNILVIDICILGDCSAWQRICCFWKPRRGSYDGNHNNGNSGNNSSGDSGNNTSDRSRRDVGQDGSTEIQMVSSTTTATADDPTAFLYNDRLINEEKRLILLNGLLQECQVLSSSASCIIGENDTMIGEHHGEDDSGQRHGTTKSILSIEEGCHIHSLLDDDSHGSVAEILYCSICLQAIESNRCFVKNCQHPFHKPCIVTWMVRSLKCPVCREDMISKDVLLDYLSSNHPKLLS